MSDVSNPSNITPSTTEPSKEPITFELTRYGRSLYVPTGRLAEAFRKLWIMLASIPLEAISDPYHPGWSKPFEYAQSLFENFDSAVAEAKRIDGVLGRAAGEVISQAEAVILELIDRLNARDPKWLPGLLAPACIRIGEALDNLTLGSLSTAPQFVTAYPINDTAQSKEEGPAEPNADWLTQQRLRCYPLVPLEELRPRRPRPQDSEILTAMRAVPVALMESRFGSTTPHLPASSCEHCLNHSAWLAFAQESGHGRAAAEWAVYRLVEMGWLYVVWPSIEQHTQRSAEWAVEQAERYRGRPATVTDWDLFECGRILQIRSTLALWEWFQAGCPDNTSTNTPKTQQGKEQTPNHSLPVNTHNQTTEGRGKQDHGPPALDDLPERARLAFLQHRQAVQVLIEENRGSETDVTDDVAYEHLKGEDMKLPELNTWKRNLREARRLLGQQKKKRRPKYNGRSAARPEHFGDHDDN